MISFGLSDFALDIRMPGVTPKQVREVQFFFLPIVFLFQGATEMKSCLKYH